MGCCGSTANVHEDDQPARNVSGTEQIQIPIQVRAQVPIPTPPASALDPSPSNSSRRTRTHSQHKRRRSTERSDTRSRAISAPQQVKPTKSSSSQHSQHSSEPRKRANTSVGPRASHSTPRPPNPGEGNFWLGYEPLITAL